MHLKIENFLGSSLLSIVDESGATSAAAIIPVDKLDGLERTISTGLQWTQADEIAIVPVTQKPSTMPMVWSVIIGAETVYINDAVLVEAIRQMKGRRHEPLFIGRNDQ